MEKLFRLRQNGTTPSVELRAGLTTFVAMAYIIFLNPVYLAETGMPAAGVLTATCLSAALGTILSAFLSNKPFAMASGMGMNAYFTYTLCFGCGFTWQQALALTFLSGGVFLLLALIFGRKAVGFIPENLRHAITAGIGLFLMLIGALDAGLIRMTAGFPELGDLVDLRAVTALLGLAVTLLLTLRRVRGSLIFGMLLTAGFSLAAGQTALPERLLSLPTALGDVVLHLDFRGLSGAAGGAAALAAMILSVSIVDMFDTLGFLIGTASKTEQTPDSSTLGRVLIADAGATMLGALCGTSTVTVYAESAAGMEAGGRTGLSALVTAACFSLALFFSPVTALFSSAVTAPALITVGLLLLTDIRCVRFDSPDDAIPALVTVAAMPLAYSITTGIGAGFLTFALCKLAAGKRRELTIPAVLICGVFLLYFCL